MAQLCSKCGNEIPAGAGFCSACGASQKGGSKVLRIVLIVIAVLVGLGIVGAGAVVFLFKLLSPAPHSIP